MRIRHRFRFFVACTALVASGVSNSASATSTITPIAITADRSGLWISGDDAQGNHLIVKYDNAMNVVFARKRDGTLAASESTTRSLRSTRDGGVMVVSLVASSTPNVNVVALDKLDSAGVEQWSAIGSPNETSIFGIDNSGGAWTANRYDIVRIAPGGVFTTVGKNKLPGPDGSGNASYETAVDPVTSTLYVAQHSVPSSLLSPYEIVSYDTTGSAHVVWTATDASLVIRFMTIDQNSNVYAIGYTSTGTYAFSVSSTGVVRWQKSFGSALDVPTKFDALPDGTMLALGATLYEIGSDGTLRISRTIESNATAAANDTIALAPNADAVVTRPTPSEQTEYLRFDSAGSTLVDATFVHDVFPLASLADGSELIGSDKALTTQALPALARVSRSGAALAAPNLSVTLTATGQLRVDQSGFDGAWYSPAESGQGFTIDYISGTLFIPWFTYNLSPVNDPSGLVWLTFQGAAPTGARSLDMVIAQTDPGAFNAGEVPAHQVGTAKIWFSDCSTGRLQYQFNADTFGGQGGYIPILRILPSTEPCLLVNGDLAAAQNTDPPANGFDARQSGSWFDPATSGQGIEWTIVPSAAGFNGFIFGAWFTFDAPPANDVAHQQWFTLQGDLSGAVNGTVTLPILQSIGGSLDSQMNSSITQVGTATLTMLACDHATFAYHFQNSAAAGTFANLSGTINLTKIGGCQPQ